MAADQARRLDPTLAAKYQRLMIDAGKHHNSALCHVAATLLTRIVACWRADVPYQLRDLDGTLLTPSEARAIVTAHHTIPMAVRATRVTTTRTGRRHQESRRAPSTDPSTTHARPAGAA